jgi:hypothetical protein
MICNHCGNQVDDNANICGHCGAILSAPVPPVPPAPPVPGNPIQHSGEIPSEYKPLSPWAYFWLSILFSIPVVGFIFLLVFSFNGSNINRRNYARSYWCGLLIALVIILIYVVIAVAFLGGLSGALNDLR